MMRGAHSRWALIAICIATACSCRGDRIEPATQIIVAVHSLLEPPDTLSRIDVRVETEAGGMTDQNMSFERVDRDPGPEQVVLPAAITIVPASLAPASRFRLSVVGHHREANGSEVPWVSRTAALAFAPGKTLKATFVLAAECAGLECPGETCYVRTSMDETREARGECGPVALAETEVIAAPSADDDSALATVLDAGPPPRPPEPPAALPAGRASSSGACAANPCEHGRCVKSGADYLCSCSGSGFEGPLCERDIDECGREHGGCAPAARCINMPGTHRCACPDTHRGDGIGPQGCETRVLQLAARGSHTCARLATGEVKCWGRNHRGQVGDGSLADRPAPVRVEGLGEAIQIAAGDDHSCAITSERAVHCWGDNLAGQLGDGTTEPRPLPVLVGGGHFADDIAIGANHSCIREGAAAVWCWGWNFNGQLGDESQENYTTPVRVAYTSDGSARPVQLLSAGELFSCAAHDAGVDCWGEFKPGTATSKAPRRYVDEPVRILAAGRHQACAVTMSDSVLCWGDVTSATPASPDGDGRAMVDLGTDKVVQLAMGEFHACGVLEDGTVKCWNAAQSGSSEPQRVPGLTEVQQVALGLVEGCALAKNGSVQCWQLTEDVATLPQAQPSPLSGF